MSNILDGKACAKEIREQIKKDVDVILHDGKIPPGLAVVFVGEDKASKVYVAAKQKACDEVGFYSEGIHLPVDTPQSKLLEIVHQLNNDDKIHGILIQLPLPSHLDATAAINNIAPHKDVDGFTPANMGSMIINEDSFIPCTPLGIMKLMERYKIEIEGKNALVIGRSRIVGLPVASLLTAAHATVTIAHTRTKNLPELVATSDIVVATVGRAELVKGSWVKQGATIIDVGINSIEDPTARNGYRLVGDVEFAEASKKADWITPVPGGVGPMTIAMLLSNTLKARNLILKK